MVTLEMTGKATREGVQLIKINQTKVKKDFDEWHDAPLPDKLEQSRRNIPSPADIPPEDTQHPEHFGSCAPAAHATFDIPSEWNTAHSVDAFSFSQLHRPDFGEIGFNVGNLTSMVASHTAFRVTEPKQVTPTTVSTLWSSALPAPRM